MLLCLSMARMTFRGAFPGVVAVVFWSGLLLGCGQDRDGPLRVEGKLLLGHAQQVSQGGAGDGRRIVSRPAGAEADSWVRPSPEYWRQPAGRRWGQASRAT